MSGAISFTQIPANARVPLFHVEFDASRAGIAQPTPRALLIGITLVSQPATPVFVPSLAWAAAAFGIASPLYAMVAAYRQNDPIGELWALPVAANGSGVQATGTLTFTGTATASGTLAVYIGGQVLYVPIAAGDTATVVAASLLAAATALSPATLPVAVTTAPIVSPGVVTFTANAKGLYGNFIDVRLNYAGSTAGESLPAGLSATIVAMASGTLDPVLTTPLGTLGDQPFDYIVQPFLSSTATTAMSLVMNNTTGRWSDISQAYGHVFAASTDTLANLVSLGGTLNDPHLSIFGLPKSPSPPYVIAAAATGALVQAINNDPARPVQTLPVAGVLSPAGADRLTNANRQQLLTNGIATIFASQIGALSLERAVTTYRTDGSGNPSIAYLDAETPLTLMKLTRDLKAFVGSTFGRCKIADNGATAGPGSAIQTPNSIKAALVARYRFLERQGLVERTDLFAAGLVVQRNANDPTRVDVLYDPYLVSGLRIFATMNQFRLGGGAANAA